MERRRLRARLKDEALTLQSEASRSLFSKTFGTACSNISPTMKSAWMMRPQKNGDAVVGPFLERGSLEAVLSEMGRLAIQVGEVLDAFFSPNWSPGLPSRLAFAEVKRNWITTFYPATQRQSGWEV